MSQHTVGQVRLTQAGASHNSAIFPRGEALAGRFRVDQFQEVMRAMFAIVRTGGKQYRVAAGDKIVVEKIAGDAGSTVSLGDVLFAGNNGESQDVGGLTVSAEIIAQAKGEKVIVFKKRRRHNYRRKNGHRQQHTILRITAIGDHKADQQQARVEAPAAAEA
jgi:large subunit ribosomal protein L21